MSNVKISKNALSNIVGLFVQIAIAFVLSPFLVHTLGDTKYGIWTIAVAFTGYMNLLDLGISSAINKYVAKYDCLNDQEKINAILSSALTLFCIVAVLIIFISPLMAEFIITLINFEESLNDIVYLLIIIVSFDISIFIVRGLFKGAFAGYQQYSVINVVQIGSAIYKGIMFYMFLSSGYGLISMGIISITANLCTLVIFYLWLKKSYPEVSIRIGLFEKKQASKILHYSKFTFLAMFANQIIYYTDAFVIGYFLSAAAVTYYSIPWTLAEYAKKVSISISQTYMPAISEKEASGDMDTVKSLYLSGTKYMIIISNLLSIGVFVLGGAFISLWMGPKYKELCEMVLIIMFVNQYFLGPQLISYSILQGLAKQRVYSIVSFGVSVVNLILSILLVQKWGIVGVAIGAAIPQILFHGFFVPWLTLRTLNMSKWDYFRTTHLISFTPTLILFAILSYLEYFYFPASYFELLSFAVVGSITYLTLVYLLMLDHGEKEVVLRLSRKILPM